MNKDLTEIILIVDRSGSMGSCKSDAEEAIGKFIAEQSKVEGQANITLVQFDHEVNTVIDRVSIKDVPKYVLIPRGSTSLYDAIGLTINTTGSRLSALDDSDRPGLVVVAILTDGYENTSKEFTAQSVKKMVEHQSKKYNWKFTYLGAGEDAILEGAKIGVDASATALFTSNLIGKTVAILSSQTSLLRSNTSKGVDCSYSYSAEERKSMTE